MDQQDQLDYILCNLKNSIVTTRKQLLDMLEMAFGDHPKWPTVRSYTLRTLGRSGLEGIIEEINAACGGSASNQEHR